MQKASQLIYKTTINFLSDKFRRRSLFRKGMDKQFFIFKFDVNAPVETVACFDIFWMCWKLMGISVNSNKWYLTLYDIIVNIFVTISYPIHLTIGIFLVPTLADVDHIITVFDSKKVFKYQDCRKEI